MEFLEDAIRVSHALGGVERLAVAEAAGWLRLDQLETVADRILENAEGERATIAQLVEDMAGPSPGAA